MIKNIIILLFLICLTMSEAASQGMSLSIESSQPETFQSLNHFIKSHGIKENRAKFLASNIIIVAHKYNLKWMTLASLISIESSFIFNAVNNTGDFGGIQLNIRIWAKEFKRLKIPFNLKEFNISIVYQLETMARILNIIRDRHPNDPFWVSRYHSGTPKYKNVYTDKLNKKLAQIEKGPISGTL